MTFLFVVIVYGILIAQAQVRFGVKVDNNNDIDDGRTGFILVVLLRFL